MRDAGPYSHPDARRGILMCRCAAIGPNRLSREAIMNKNLLVSILMALTVTAAAAQAPTKDALIARAKSFELDTSYVPPPGDPLTHHAAGFAKVMCSAVFMTGLAPDFAAENVGFFTAPYGERAKLGKPVIDRANKAVHIRLPNGVTRTATYLGSQGCVTLPIGESAMNFKPVAVNSRLPDPATQLWQMGTSLPQEPLPTEIDAEKLKAAVNAAFQPAEGLTAAFVVTWKGRLIAERYAEGLTAQTPLEGWSMGKSVTATLFAVLRVAPTARMGGADGRQIATVVKEVHLIRVDFGPAVRLGDGRPLG